MISNFINGSWTSSTSDRSRDVINPATEEVLDKVPLSNTNDVMAAVSAACHAYPSWRDTPVVDRIQYFFRLKELLEKNREHLSKIITLEHGKTLEESRGSVRRAIQMVETACAMPTLSLGEHCENIARGIDSSSVKRPMGVFAGIAPFNFPVMVPFWFWPFAVASGNTYVLKPSEQVPLTFTAVGKLIEECGFPKGVFNIIHGDKEVVDALCTHPEIKGISFVGSTKVARHVYTLATSHGKRVQALGGAKNLMVALPDAMTGNLAQASVQTAVESITGCAGQRCLAGSLVLCVGEECYEKFKNEAKTLAAKITIGDGQDPNVQMGPLISKEAKNRVLELIDFALVQGAKILLDGRETKKNKGYFLGPTVLYDVKSQDKIAQEEIFGPVVLLAKVDSLNAAISWINSLPYANTTTLFTSSGASARKFAKSVDPTMIGINIGVPAPMSFFSFGGSKQSFFGDLKAHGKSGTEFFTDTCTTIYRWHGQESIWSG